ncbi:MAG: hypothetical protein ACMVO3_22730 [Thalassobaculum sp.]
MLVKFTRSVTPYMAGETADFTPKEADMLIASGRAVKWPPEGRLEQQPAPPAPKVHEAVVTETREDPRPAVTKPVRGRRGKRR